MAAVEDGLRDIAYKKPVEKWAYFFELLAQNDFQCFSSRDGFIRDQ